MKKGESEGKSTRRKVLRTTAGLGALSGVSLFATGVGSAEVTKTGSKGYAINEDGFIEYQGDSDEEHIQAAVEGMNEAKREGKIDFTIQDGNVVTRPQNRSEFTPDDSCPGENGYSNSVQLNGVKHTIKIDHCLTNDVIDAMLAGAGVAQIAAILTGGPVNAPAFVISECAAVLLATGWQIVDNNAEGEGVQIVVFFPNVIGVPGIDPQ